MIPDRIVYDLDSDGHETDLIDEIVIGSASVHLEGSSRTSAWMSIQVEGQEELRVALYAEPVSRPDRRKTLRQEQDRLIDHLGCLLPWRWHPRHPHWVGWAIPVHRRPAAAVRDWWDARRRAGVVLTVMEES